MKSKIAYSALAATVLLALTPLAAAQGPSGGTGAIASIPGSVVRAAEERKPVTQPGIIGIVTNATPPNSKMDSRQKTTRRGESPMAPK